MQKYLECIFTMHIIFPSELPQRDHRPPNVWEWEMEFNTNIANNISLQNSFFIAGNKKTTSTRKQPITFTRYI